jgi:hypothetical protein
MAWIPEEHMAEVHTIRQDYAQALAVYESVTTIENRAVLAEAQERRDRAIRMIHEEDGMNVRHLAAMFRCSKTVIRDALAVEQT